LALFQLAKDDWVRNRHGTLTGPIRGFHQRLDQSDASLEFLTCDQSCPRRKAAQEKGRGESPDEVNCLVLVVLEKKEINPDKRSLGEVKMTIGKGDLDPTLLHGK
jgi:hypothetical protein